MPPTSAQPAGAPATDATARPAERSPASLSGQNLTLSYGKRVVVDGVSLRLESGRVTALVGPNGSGKSTLLRSLARLHQIDDGTVLLDGGTGHGPRRISLLSGRQFAREVTMFSQSRPAPHGLTASDVVAFGRHPHRRGFVGLSAEDHRAVDHAMVLTGVTALSHRAVGELSGGEMQRVWLAACLAQHTGVILLDEPTNHLDLRFQIETLDLVRDLADDHGVAVGIVLHDLDHAARVADELLLMSAGRIHSAGNPVDVLTAENIGDVYDIPVEVGVDERTGRLRIDAVGRHPARARVTAAHTPSIAPSN